MIKLLSKKITERSIKSIVRRLDDITELKEIQLTMKKNYGVDNAQRMDQYRFLESHVQRHLIGIRVTYAILNPFWTKAMKDEIKAFLDFH